VRVKTAIYDPSPRAPKASTTAVDVYQPGEAPARPHRFIALLTIEGAAHEEAECVQGMLTVARRLGADGLAILVPEAPNQNIAFKYGWAGPSPDRRVFKANALVYDAR